jgi:hypothetical protein
MLDGILIFILGSPWRPQAPAVVLVVPPLGRGGISRLWQARLAAWNFAFDWMFRGKIGPVPEKFGFGRL